MKKVLTIGGVMHDIFIEYERSHMIHLTDEQQKRSFILLEEGKKIEIKNIDSYVGGGAANSAVSFERLGFETEAFFKIGSDTGSTFILGDLQKNGVKLDYIVRSEDQKTGTSFIIPCPSGNRTVLVYRGANQNIEEKELPLKAIANCDQLYVTSLSQAAAKLLIPITVEAKKYNKQVACNPGGSQLKEGSQFLINSLPNIDILILNGFETQECMAALGQAFPDVQQKLKQQTQEKKPKLPQLLQAPISYKSICFNLKDYFKTIMAQGPQIVVVTNGAEGVYVAHQNIIYFYQGLKVKIVSTVGAGDAFGSCFVGYLLRGKSIEESLMAGIINSASVIGHIGTQTGLLHFDEIEERMAKIDKSLLQRFELK
jgi:sugar/nucleoside kinase (ribokinase family)